MHTGDGINVSDEWAIWTFYNVLLPAILPVGLVWGGLKLVNKPKALLEIIGDGQLCFFSIALVAVTINDISNMSSEKRNAAWAARHLRWAEPIAYLTIIIIVFVFGLVVSKSTGSTQSDKRRLTLASAILTVFALVMVYFWRLDLELF